jgi:SAM-dependent methyltransferase
VADLVTEDSEAKRYWSATEAQPHGHAGTPPHVLALVDLCLEAQARRILEFGCFSGRNLLAIREAFAAAGELDPELVGLDINAKALDVGNEAGLDLRLGDETALHGFADGQWDVVLTVSVLDHMPDPTLALEQLARITARRLILIEPQSPDGGSGKALGQAGDDPMPFTYLHDYDALLLGLGLVQELDMPMPTHHHRVGPLYRLRSFSRSLPSELDHLLDRAGAILPHDLRAACARRFPRRPNGTGPRLHLATDAGGLGTALTMAAEADLIVAPQRALARLPAAMLNSWSGTPIDGFLAVLGRSGAPDHRPAPWPSPSERLRERVLTRILLQNREDATHSRILEARLRRLAEASGGEATEPAPPTTTSDAATGRSVSRQLSAARSAWMIRELTGLVEEQAQRATRWRRLMAGKAVTFRVGRRRRDAVVAELAGSMGEAMLRTGEGQRPLVGRQVAQQLDAAQRQSLIEQAILLHRLGARWSRPAGGWKGLRRSVVRAAKSFWARLPGHSRGQPAPHKRAAFKA